jgi:hypothetical protein
MTKAFEEGWLIAKAMVSQLISQILLKINDIKWKIFQK